MTRWFLAAVAGLVVALAGYAPALRYRAALAWLAAARGVAVALVAAVALGAPLSATARAARIVALDASASWSRAADPRDARAAADTAGRLAGGARLAGVGESLRVATASALVTPPTDRATRVAALAESAAATGVPLSLVTDGEVDDPDALARAPAGSRVVVLRPTRGRDAAVLDVTAPTSVAPGDTVTVAVTVAADAAGSNAGRIGVYVDGANPTERALPVLGAFGRTSVSVPLVIASDARARVAVLSAAVTTSGDREPRNDTVSRALEITAAPRAVLVSTAPDYDVGVALSVLRGALAVPVRAYYRVAPGTWRVAGTLAPAREADVRAAAAGAAIVLLHGDTAVLGNPRAIGRGAVALVPVADAGDSTTDWYAGPGANAGPLAGLTGLAWDSLPPLDLAGAGPDAAAAVAGLGQRWTGVVARAARRGAPRAVVAGGVDPSGRRVVVVAAGGFWRWAFRGGAGAAAAPAVWGAVFDYLADAPARAVQALAPAEAEVRSGMPIRWRGLASRDTVARVRLTRRGSAASTTLLVRRDAETGDARSDSPAPGVYDVGGGGTVVVNASAELLPRRPVLQSGPVGAPAIGAAPAVAPLAPGWPLAAATLLLCGEWIARRRLGLR